ncbi:hypothetical protein CHUAL_007492 [Chamberlinius hualienensis]
MALRKQKLLIIILVTIVVTVFWVSHMNYFQSQHIHSEDDSFGWHILVSEDKQIVDVYSLNANVLVLVFSEAKNKDKRMAIRNTWGGSLKNRIDTSLTFVVTNQMKADDEIQLYEDIITIENADTDTMLLKILNESLTFPNVDFVLKITDHVFLNPFNFETKLNTWKESVEAIIISGPKNVLNINYSTLLLNRKAMHLLQLATKNNVSDVHSVDKLITTIQNNNWTISLFYDSGFDVQEEPLLCDSISNHKIVTYAEQSSAVTYTLWWLLNDSRLQNCEKLNKDKNTINDILSYERS